MVTILDNIADLAVSDPAVNVPGVGVALTMMQTNRRLRRFRGIPAGV